MSTSAGAVLLIITASMGQASGVLPSETRKTQDEIFERWWGKEMVWRFESLPAKAKVPKERVPYSGHIYPDVNGGTTVSLQKYDRAFNSGRMLATAHERRDTSITENTTRTITERYGFRGRYTRTRVVRTNAVPYWYGHCNGWTSAAIRHSEPKKSVKRNGVVFSPADIKGLLAEIYMYNEMEMLAGTNTEINPAMLHVLLANWLGRGTHPIGMEADPGKEKWNYPMYGFSSEFYNKTSRSVDVVTVVTYAGSSRGEFDESPRIPMEKRFNYHLDFNDQGEIVGGFYYNGSARIDMLWAPLSPKASGKKGNESGNPHVDVSEVLAIWRDSVSDEVRRSWAVIDPPNESPLITSKNYIVVAENQLQILTVTATDGDLNEPLHFLKPQKLRYSIDGGKDEMKFSISPETGELTFVSAADFEQPGDSDANNTYEVKVKVDDGAGGTAAQVLRVAVTDTNDAPTITSPNKAEAAENQLAVFTVSLADEDLPKQTLACSLVGGSDRDQFTINPTTGELTFNQVVDFEQPADANHDNVYEVELKVEDSQGGLATQLLKVAVVNVNERPIITYTPKVLENQTEVLTINVTDEDMSMQDDTTISLSGGADRKLFTIDAKTGDLAFKTAPDFEHPTDADADNIYEVEVKVDDGHGGVATQRLRVKVTDVDEAPLAAAADASETKDVESDDVEPAAPPTAKVD